MLLRLLSCLNNCHYLRASWPAHHQGFGVASAAHLSYYLFPSPKEESIFSLKTWQAWFSDKSSERILFSPPRLFIVMDKGDRQYEIHVGLCLGVPVRLVD